MCPNPTPAASSPRTVTTVGRVLSVSAGTVTTVASPNEANARALTRSAGHKGGAEPRIAVLRQLNGDLRVGIDVHLYLANRKLAVFMQPPQPPQRRKPPLLLPPRRHREVSQLERLPFVQPRNGGAGLRRPLKHGHQPTAPSICSSISRFSSSAYSIGSSRAIGSTKPRTIVAMASSSVMPRLIR